MSTVREWFDEFAITLVERTGRVDLPEGGTEYWEDFEKSLVRIGATRHHADEASSGVCDLPNLFPNQYRPMIVESVRKLQAREQAESRGIVGGSLQDAQKASQQCPDCHGSGWTVRYIHPGLEDLFQTSTGGPVPTGAGLAMFCACPLGVFLHHTEKTAEPARRTGAPSIGQHPDLLIGPVEWSQGFDNAYRHRPEDWDADREQPAGEPVIIQTPDDLRAYCASLLTSPGVGRSIPPRRPQSPHSEPTRPLPGRPELDAAIPDPVIDRERRAAEASKPAQPESAAIPEDFIDGLL